MNVKFTYFYFYKKWDISQYVLLLGMISFHSIDHDHFSFIDEQGGVNVVNSHFGCFLLTGKYLLLTAKFNPN